jgi:rhomboid family GlyGly-CTERM serine protease
MASAENLIRGHPATLAVFMAGVLAAAGFVCDSPVESLGWWGGGEVGAAWRLLTAHFIHLNAAHGLANLVAALLIGWSCDRLGLSGRLPAATLAALVSVDLGLVFGPWTITWYAGFSGVLHGLFAWLCLCLALTPLPGRSASMRGLAMVLFLGGLVKVVAALATPVGTPGWLGVPQATPAHLYGYLGGTLWVFLRRER